VAQKKGIDISAQVCRQISSADFEDFDYILAMDKDNLKRLKELCPKELHGKLHLFLPFAKDLKGLSEIPDPYLFRDIEAFERVYDFVDRASKGLLEDIIRQHFPKDRGLSKAVGSP
jgi:protein-tyrosine phosphatase